jgi:hypothetical protein
MAGPAAPGGDALRGEPLGIVHGRKGELFAGRQAAVAQQGVRLGPANGQGGHEQHVQRGHGGVAAEA